MRSYDSFMWDLHVTDCGWYSVNEHSWAKFYRLVCEDYPELTLPLENTILVNVDYDDYKSMRTVCDKYNKAVENIKNLWKGTARPDQLRTRPSCGKRVTDLGYFIEYWNLAAEGA